MELSPGQLTSLQQKTTLWMGELEPWMDENYIRQLWSVSNDAREDLMGWTAGSGWRFEAIMSGSHVAPTTGPGLDSMELGRALSNADAHWRAYLGLERWASFVGRHIAQSGACHCIRGKGWIRVLLGVSSDFCKTYSLGETVNVKMIRDKITVASAGYCFVDFSSNAAAARQLTTANGSIIPGTNKVFKLNWASGGGMVDRTRDSAGPEYSIFVGDLSPEVNDLLLMNTFQARYGSIKSAKVVTDPQTGMSRGYGFVRFSEEIDQQRAMNEMNGQYCGSRPMRIASATPKNKMGGGGLSAGGSVGGGMGMQGGMGMGMGMGMQALGMQGMGMPQQGMGYYGMPMQGMPPQQMQQQHHQQQQHPYGVQQGYNPFTDPSNTTVFIGGLNPSVTDEDLKQHFAQFGEILHTKIPPGRGCGFVTYAHRPSAETAIQQMNNAIIGAYICYVPIPLRLN
ncbi:hypothetical protein HK101_009118 [Irineochytrium annulatum]|nr:hypothetical protein HK101_009118 [Irineochytrium annulatum]